MRLLVRQQDVEPDRGAPASRAPRLAASISPGPPPVITANPASPIARPISRARAYAGRRRRAGRAEDADRGADAGRATRSPGAQLALDQLQALWVGARGGDRALLGADDLLAESGWVTVGAELPCQVRVRGPDYLRESTWKHPNDHSSTFDETPATAPSARSTTGS